MSDHDFKPSDWRARQQALNPVKSYIVQAPAGSGKTELLIQRILVLLAHVERPEEILAITFTRKAAGEMHARLMAALQRATSDHPPSKPHEKTTWHLAREALKNDDCHQWHLLDNPNRLQVMTIDSFCAALTRRLPWLSCFGSQPSITDAPGEYYAEAATRLLERVENNERGSRSARCLLRHLDNQLWTLRNMLVDMLGKRDQWLRHVLPTPEVSVKEVLEGALRNHVHNSLLAAYHALGEELRIEISELISYASINIANDGHNEIAADLRRLDGLTEPTSDDWRSWHSLLDLLLTKQDKLRSTVNRNQGFPPGGHVQSHMKERMLDVLNKLAENPSRVEALVNLRHLPRSSYSQSEWHILQALTNLLPLAVMELQQVFREQGVVDFIEVAGAARAALGRASAPEDLLLQLDSQLGHILVDEFQDTSFGQFVLLEQLTSGWVPGDGRTLFVVGDPMQSIYRFREADVGLYLRVRRAGLNNVVLEPLTLEANFRSQAGIVKWVNTAFGSLFPAVSDESTGAVPYVKATAVQPARAGESVTHTAYLDRHDELEAEHIVGLIRKSLEELPGGTVAVLVRSRNHLEKIVMALKHAGLKFQAQDLEPLGQKSLIQDLRSLTRALLHPADRVSWLAILRAPWCGLDLDDLLKICGHAPYETIWDLLVKPALQGELFEPFGENTSRRLERFCRVMERTLKKKGRIPLRKLVESCWLSLHGPACISASDRQDADRYFQLLEELDDAGELVRLEQLDDRLETLYAAIDAEASSNVQVMTIHKAKGLEFDVVILPGLGKTIQSAQRTLLRWQEMPDDHLLLAPLPELYGNAQGTTYQSIGRLMKIKDDHETLRLLYVAATRAKTRLHLLGHVKMRTDGRFSPERNSLLDVGWSVWQKGFCEHLHEDETGRTDRHQPAQVVQRLPIDWAPPSLDKAVFYDGLQFPKVAQRSVDSPELHHALSLQTEEGRLIGTVTHAWLERIAKDGLTEWSHERLNAFTGQIKNQLQNAGVPAGRLNACSAITLTALQTALKSERGRWILDDHLQAMSEYAINGICQGNLVHAVIDRTFIDDGGVRWIIDFKTSAPRQGSSFEQFLAMETERYRPQMAIYRELFGLLEPDREIQTAIYFPVVDEWCVYTAEQS